MSKESLLVRFIKKAAENFGKPRYPTDEQIRITLLESRVEALEKEVSVLNGSVLPSHSDYR